MKKLVCIVPLVLAAAGCPKPRTSAATQPTPAAFDPAQSEPAAIAVVDAGVAALGGADKWAKLKELRFTMQYTNDGKLQAEHSHWWDRWNGRHRMQNTDISTLGGDPDDVRSTDVRYDLFDKDGTPHATYGGSVVDRKSGAEMATGARTALTQDLYFVAMMYKLQDPGVMLKVENAAITVSETVCQPSCTSIKVTFDPAVGTDVWFVNFNNDSKLPEVIELQKGPGRVGYRLADWIDAGGLKWPGALHNIGLPAEVIKVEGVKVGEPDDATYLPSVGG